MLFVADSGIIRCAAVALALAALAPAECAVGETRLAPEHFIDYAAISHVAISPDGERVLVTTRRADSQDDRMIRRHWLVDADGQEQAIELQLPRGSRALAWHPDGERIAWLARTDTGPQVHLREPEGGDGVVITESRGGVTAFEFSPDGRQLAYTTVEMRPAGSPPSDQGRRGVEIDVEQFGVVHLLAGRLGKPTDIRRHARLRLLDRDSDSVSTVAEDRSVKHFAFSPQGDRLAVTAVSGAHHAAAPTQGEDLLVHHIETGRTELIAEGSKGRDGSMYKARVSHALPAWSPSGDRIAFLRTDHSAGMAAVSEIGIHHSSSGTTRMLTDAERTEPAVAGIHWHDQSRILIERKEQARRGLYALTTEDGDIRPVRARHGDDGRFSFSADGSKAAWVAQSTTQPPEIHAGDPNGDAIAVTRFNAELAGLPLKPLEELSWRSSDDREVRGWLMTPDDAGVDSPAPLIVALAGGPGFVLTNRYDLFPRGVWPYPLQVLADRGYAVLIVHYRGTSSFGPRFRRFTPGREDVADVHAGVRAVAERAEIDGERLGILGHSHGAWLGPMAANGGPQFRVASFAEGIGNFLGAYLGLDGRRNLDLHEADLGATPWQDPQRYLDLSPAFSKQLIENTATLIEAGEQAAAVEALQFAKAFWRHDTPHELVLYPDTGHNITKPATMLESMQRNLAWFADHLPIDT